MVVAFAMIFIVSAIVTGGSWIHDMYEVAFKD